MTYTGDNPAPTTRRLRNSPWARHSPAIVALAIVPLQATAQEKASDTLLTVQHYLNYETVAAPSISPDGREIIYTRRWVNTLEDKWETALWLVRSDGSRNYFLVKGSNAVWSPDGSRIAYLAEGEPKGTQVFVRWMDGAGATSQVTRLTERPADLRWSPDGKSIGFTAFVPAEPRWKIDLPATPSGGKWTAAPRIVEQLHFRQDRRGFLETGHRHLFVAPADGGTPRQLTKGSWSVGARFDALFDAVSWSWSPDGRTITIDGISDTTADLNYRNSNIYSVDVATGSVRRLTPQDGVWTNPVFSPDGRLIAFVGYPAMRVSYRAPDIYVMRPDGSSMRKISGDFDREPSNLFWHPDGTGVYFSAMDRGRTNVYFASLDGRVRPITTGNHLLTMSSMSRNQVGAAVRTSYQNPPDILRVDLARGGRTEQLTSVNADLLAGKRLGEVENFTYTSSDGTRAEGWIVKPPSFDPTRRYPLVMEIHGGPHAAYTVGFSYMFQNFAANGYVVLYTNPRGSTSYGSPFANAIERAYPSVDYNDLIAGVDAVVARGFIDEKSMFVGGCSGGGVLTSWVIGHTNRFAAATVRCPVINWLSFAGQTDIPLFTHNFFDAPFWEKPEQWLRQSPLMYVGNVNTPTLLITGELDLRTPIAQTDEYYAALKMRGVPSTLLRFQGEYHGTASIPSNFMRTQLYMLSWYERWKGTGQRPPVTATAR